MICLPVFTCVNCYCLLMMLSVITQATTVLSLVSRRTLTLSITGVSPTSHSIMLSRFISSFTLVASLLLIVLFFSTINPSVGATCSHRDLGIILSEDLSWSLHYKSIVSKALITLNLLRRVFGTSGSIRVRKLLYLSLVRSKLTYCSPIWRPQQRQHVLLLESVQRRATKWILNDYVSDYKTRLSSLEILPLMMLYEFHDIVFFLKSLKSPTPAFNIMTFVTFSSNQT